MRQPRQISWHRIKSGRTAAFTFTETLIAAALFILVVIGVIYTHIFGLRLSAIADSKLSATHNARAALNKVRDEIRSGKILYVGNGDANTFTRPFPNAPQIGNALQIHLTTDTNVYVRYYLDLTEKSLMRKESSTGDVREIARYLTNQLVFQAEDHLGSALTNDQNNRVIRMTLEFFRWEYPVAEVGSGRYYSSYRFRRESRGGRLNEKFKPSMKLHFHRCSRQTGYALLLALVFVALSLLLLTSMLQRTSGSTSMTDRNNDYNRAVGAAEAATEKVLSVVNQDFINQHFTPGNLVAYRSLMFTNDWAAEYEFSDGAGMVNQAWLTCSPTPVLTNLDSQFTGLYGQAYICSVRANAKSLSAYDPELAAAVRQDYQLASIPLFQFGIYYAVDLEIHPLAARIITGKVHGGANIYVSPASPLEFADSVGAVGKIYPHRHPDDPNPNSVFTPFYHSIHQEKVSSLTLPVGADNNPIAVRQILDPPPTGENPATLLAKQRYYNKADLIITTTNTRVTVRFDANSSPIPSSELMTNGNYIFLNTNVTFFDYREGKPEEGKPVVVTEIDVRKLKDWMATNSFVAGRTIKTVYVNDRRYFPGKLVAVRLVNGRQLPPNGLTVVTPQPLYVQGHFNAPDLTPGSTNTSDTKPASLVGDSITILSPRWDDIVYVSTTPLTTRSAGSTTVNAAIIAGIVPTTNISGVKRYSGGADNFIRLLENWNSISLTYNGSMVALYPSRYATNFWASDIYYFAPLRRWSFDANFLTWEKLPPSTPMVQKLVRGRWNTIAAESPN